MDERFQGSDILIVDDRPEHLNFVSDVLSKEGYKARTAASGVAALEEVKRRAPDLILLDVLMPEMDGYEVCRRLKSDPRTRDIPVIYLSVAKEASDKIRALGTGGVDYVSKPFVAEELCARIHTHLKLYMLHRELAMAKEDAQQKAVFLRGVLDNVEQGISVFDNDLHLVAWNHKFRELMDLPDELLRENVPVHELYLFNAERGEYGEGDPKEIADRLLEEAKTNRTKQDHQWERVRPNGMVIEVIGKIMSDGSIVSTHTDVTERRKKEERTKRQAMRDSLTGLANRRAFEAEVLEAMKEADESAAGMILAMIDLDNFKEVNDRHGHAIGDATLKFFATLLQAQIRLTDFSARLGGDEFAIIFRNTNQLPMVQDRVERIIRKTAEKRKIDGRQINIGASVGVSCYPLHGTGLPILMERADAALYKAKSAGKGKMAVAG